MVVVDRLSNNNHFIGLKHHFTAKNVAEIFSSQVVKLQGIPLSIVSDKDRIFFSHFWAELFKIQRTELRHNMLSTQFYSPILGGPDQQRVEGILVYVTSRGRVVIVRVVRRVV